MLLIKTITFVFTITVEVDILLFENVFSVKMLSLLLLDGVSQPSLFAPTCFHYWILFKFLSLGATASISAVSTCVLLQVPVAYVQTSICKL